MNKEMLKWVQKKNSLALRKETWRASGQNVILFGFCVSTVQQSTQMDIVGFH